MGGVDVLINNAGISIRHNFLDITPAEWDRIIAVNLTGRVLHGADRGQTHVGAGQWRNPPDRVNQRAGRPTLLR